MKRLIVPLIIFAAVGLVLSIVGLVITLQRTSRTNNPGPDSVIIEPDLAAVGLEVPPFSLTDQQGRPQTQALFDGRATILDYIFTHCPFACPMMTGAMLELQEKLKGTNVQFISITVDPERDTPEQLLTYAGSNQADLSRWTFLTGEQSVIDSVLHSSLQFELDKDERTIELPGGGQMQNIIHPTRLLLVGPDRKVLGMYDPNSEEDMRTLEIKARILARETRPR